MTKPKFTHGPWRCEPSTPGFFGPGGARLNSGVPYEYIILGSNKGGGQVLPILARTHNWPNNFVANAHLIAAAPELYAALEALKNEAFINMVGEAGGLIDDAEHALAKARGELEP